MPCSGTLDARYQSYNVAMLEVTGGRFCKPCEDIAKSPRKIEAPGKVRLGILKGTVMELKCAGTQPSVKGPAEWFTGTVRIDPLNNPPAPARVSCAAVTFEPGARTAWHSHPLGQTLIVTADGTWACCKAWNSTARN